MKNLITNYTFNAAAKTITFTDFTTIDKEKILLISNVTDGIIIYNFNDPAKLGTVATNVLTLAYDTTSMSNGDDIMIFYDESALVISGSVLNSSTSNNLIPSTDTLLFPYVSFQLLTIGSGTPTFIFEGSNDNTTWQNVNLQGAASTNAALSASAANTIFAGIVPTRYFRVRVSVAGSGGANATAVAVFRTVPLGGLPLSTVTANQGGTWNIGTVTPGTSATNLGKAEDAAHASGDTGVLDLGVRYESLTAPASAAGDYGFKQIDDLGKMVTMPYAPLVNQLQSVNTLTATTVAAAAFAAVASVRNYVTSVSVVNTGGSATMIEILDGSTVIWFGFVEATTGKQALSFPTPLKGSVNSAINVRSATSTSSVYISLTGFKAL